MDDLVKRWDFAASGLDARSPFFRVRVMVRKGFSTVLKGRASRVWLAGRPLRELVSFFCIFKRDPPSVFMVCIGEDQAGGARAGGGTRVGALLNVWKTPLRQQYLYNKWHTWRR